MEEENKKKRAVARREFNATVRELAAFVKKRDKRVAAYQALLAQQRAEKEAAEKERWAGKQNQDLLYTSSGSYSS